VPGPAADIRHRDAGRQPGQQAGHGAQEARDELLIVDPPPGLTGLGTRCGEVRRERRWRQPATPGEATFQVAERAQHRGHRRDIGRAVPGQEAGVLRRQDVLSGSRVVADQPAGDHGAEPFPDVPLGKPGPAGQARAGGRPARGRLEQAGPVADADQQGQCAAGQRAQHPGGERVPLAAVHRVILSPRRHGRGRHRRAVTP